MDNLDLEKEIKKIEKPVVETGNFGVEQKKIIEKRNEIKKEFEKENKTKEKMVEGFVKFSGVSNDSVDTSNTDTSKSLLHQDVEAILEEDLEDIYFSMTPEQQKRFKKKGEEVTVKIIKLVEEEKSTFKKILNLIVSWLKIIPGINKFFVEQEGKIKTDRILNVGIKNNDKK